MCAHLRTLAFRFVVLNHSGVMAFILLTYTVSVTARLTLVDSSAGCEDKTNITAIIASVTASAGYFAYFFMAVPPLHYFCLL